MQSNEHICKNKLKKFIFKLKTDHELITPFIPKGSKILDFGCGDCRFFDNLKDMEKLVGCEIDEECFRISKEKGYEVYKSLNKIKGKFDFIVLNEVIEHLDLGEVKDFFKKIPFYIYPKGKLILSTPNPNEAYTWLNEHESHKRLYSIKELKKMGEENNFKTIRIIKHHMRINPFKIIKNLIKRKDVYAGYTIFMEYIG